MCAAFLRIQPGSGPAACSLLAKQLHFSFLFSHLSYFIPGLSISSGELLCLGLNLSPQAIFLWDGKGIPLLWSHGAGVYVPL